MHAGVPPRLNHAALSEAVDRSRAVVTTLAEKDKARRCEAIECLSRYVDLLGEANCDEAQRYSFRRVYADGRWDIAEAELTAPPLVGGLVWFDDGGPWRISCVERVARATSAPPHEFFACDLAAA